MKQDVAVVSSHSDRLEEELLDANGEMIRLPRVVVDFFADRDTRCGQSFCKILF